MLFNTIVLTVPAMGLIGLLYTFIKFKWVAKQDPGNDKMKEISSHIAEGAMAFLKWSLSNFEKRLKSIKFGMTSISLLILNNAKVSFLRLSETAVTPSDLFIEKVTTGS